MIAEKRDDDTTAKKQTEASIRPRSVIAEKPLEASTWAKMDREASIRPRSVIAEKDLSAVLAGLLPRLQFGRDQ